MAQPIPAVMVPRRLNRATLLRSTALQAVVGLVVATPGLAQPAPSARPQGGQVVAGSASIATTANATNITQSTNRAAIDWRSFNVGSDQSVNFQQPGSTSVTLNRVTAGDPSAIAGKITANGQIVLTNPSGVTFYQGSQVNAQSVVVSAAGITNQNFMAGKMVFDQAAQPNARVENRGTITVKQAGLAALVAPSVANSGVINAKLGQVVLAGAAAHTLDMYGDGLVSIDVTRQVTQAPVGPDGKVVTALVTNTGTIRADGGVVQLTASAADGVVQTLVRAGGTIRANSVADRTGRIEIAGTGGSVVVEGRVAADGHAPGTTGGQVMIAASDTTTIASAAHVTASGKAGGGTIALGTTLARARTAGPVPAATSARTIVAAGARVSADATERGKGGRVAVLSTQTTSVAGTLTARGGKIAGDGGSVEVSGQRGFSLTGMVDTSAPHGAVGSILIDPNDLTISDTAPNGASPVTPTGSSPNVAYNNPDTATNAYITTTQINNLAGAVTFQATNDLTVASSFTHAASVTLQAGNNLTVNSGVTVPGHRRQLAHPLRWRQHHPGLSGVRHLVRAGDHRRPGDQPVRQRRSADRQPWCGRGYQRRQHLATGLRQRTGRAVVRQCDHGGGRVRQRDERQSRGRELHRLGGCDHALHHGFWQLLAFQHHAAHGRLGHRRRQRDHRAERPGRYAADRWADLGRQRQQPCDIGTRRDAGDPALHEQPDGPAHLLHQAGRHAGAHDDRTRAGERRHVAARRRRHDGRRHAWPGGRDHRPRGSRHRGTGLPDKRGGHPGRAAAGGRHQRQCRVRDAWQPWQRGHDRRRDDAAFHHCGRVPAGGQRRRSRSAAAGRAEA